MTQVLHSAGKETLVTQHALRDASPKTMDTLSGILVVVSKLFPTVHPRHQTATGGL